MYKYAVQKVNSYSSIVRLSKQRKQKSREMIKYQGYKKNIVFSTRFYHLYFYSLFKTNLLALETFQIIKSIYKSKDFTSFSIKPER